MGRQHGRADGAAMIDHGTLTGHELGDSIGEVVTPSHVALDDAELAGATGDDQHARVRPGGVALADEEQVNEAFDRNAVCDFDDAWTTNGLMTTTPPLGTTQSTGAR